MMVCSEECRQFARHNWKWLVFGTLVVVGIYTITGGTFWLVARQFWPGGQPVKVAEFAFAAEEIRPGTRATIRIISEKVRQCVGTPQLVFIDEKNQEFQYLFGDWPYLPVGESTVFVSARVPELEPGQFRYQVRIYYDCADEDFIVTSPVDEVEIARRQGG